MENHSEETKQSTERRICLQKQSSSTKLQSVADDNEDETETDNGTMLFDFEDEKQEGTTTSTKSTKSNNVEKTDRKFVIANIIELTDKRIREETI
jgi:hypothetical protein